MNEELIQSAVSFLKDPNVISSPLSKKVEFLQTKGLNEQEIEEALNRSNNSSTSTSTSTSSTNSPTTTTSQVSNNPPSNYAGAPLDYYNVQPPVPERTWKDYFIMATATAGVSYGVYQVISKYLIPSIVPPTQTTIDEDKQKIDEEFIKMDKLLEQLAGEQQQIKDANQEKLLEIDTVINSVNEFLTKYNKDKLTFDDDLRLMKLEIDNLKNSIEKNLNLTKANVKDDLQDISQELVSLKNLIKSRSSKDGQSDRKIPPASAIPSASDILKKAKAKPQESVKSPSPQEFDKVMNESVSSDQVDQSTSQPEQVPQPEQIAKPEQTAQSSNPPQSIPPQSTPPQSTPPTDSQQSHSQHPGISSSSTVNGVTAAGIPEWQLKHKLKEESKDQKPSDDIVNDTIKNVGVPSWQLNQSI